VKDHPIGYGGIGIIVGRTGVESSFRELGAVGPISPVISEFKKMKSKSV